MARLVSQLPTPFDTHGTLDTSHFRNHAPPREGTLYATKFHTKNQVQGLPLAENPPYNPVS